MAATRTATYRKADTPPPKSKARVAGKDAHPERRRRRRVDLVGSVDTPFDVERLRRQVEHGPFWTDDHGYPLDEVESRLRSDPRSAELYASLGRREWRMEREKWEERRREWEAAKRHGRRGILARFPGFPKVPKGGRPFLFTVFVAGALMDLDFAEWQQMPLADRKQLYADIEKRLGAGRGGTLADLLRKTNLDAQLTAILPEAAAALERSDIAEMRVSTVVERVLALLRVAPPPQPRHPRPRKREVTFVREVYDLLADSYTDLAQPRDLEIERAVAQAANVLLGGVYVDADDVHRLTRARRNNS